MQYSVLMSYNSIDYKAYKELETLGLRVPFDPKSPDSNVYAYLSTESSVTIGKIKSICESLHFATFGDGDNSVSMVVNEYEVNKHIERTTVINLPSIGDNVRYSEYKKLVFSVIDIQDDIATISHSLRNIDLILDIPLNNLSLVDEEDVLIYYQSTNFPLLERAIYIDSDSVSNYVQEQFTLMLRLKTMYKGYELIFINPDYILQGLLNVLQLSSVYGDVTNIVLGMGYQDILYSSNLDYLIHLPNLLLQKQGSYHSYTTEITLNSIGFNDVNSFKLYRAIKELHEKGTIEQDIDFKSLQNKVNQSYPFVYNLYSSYKQEIDEIKERGLVVNTELKVYEKNGTLDIDLLTKEFEKLKLQYFIDNIEYYIYLLKS